MKEYVRYANDFNYLLFPSFTEREMDIFMTILSRLRDDDRTVTISMHNLKGYRESFSKVTKVFQDFSDKILNYQIKHIDEQKNSVFICFDEFKLDLETKTCRLVFQEEFYNFIKNHQRGFTSFKISEFIELRGKYTKILYCLLQQFRATGRIVIFRGRWDDFRKLMQIPESFTMGEIDKQILQPAIKQLSLDKNPLDNIGPIFKNLKYRKIKDKRRRGQGGKVIGIEFYFIPIKPFKSKTMQQDRFQAKFLLILFSDVIEIIKLPLLILEIPRLIKWIGKQGVKNFNFLKKKIKDLRTKALKS